MTNAEVGARIRHVREQRGWTQLDLGRRLDPSRSHAAVSDIERGLTHLDVEDLTMVAGVLGTTLAHLLALDDRRRRGTGDRALQSSQVGWEPLLAALEQGHIVLIPASIVACYSPPSALTHTLSLAARRRGFRVEARRGERGLALRRV